MDNFKTAKLFDAGGDLLKRWYVYYSFRSPETGKFRLFQKWIPQKIMSCSGRSDKAHAMIKSINMKLRQGFNPFAQIEKKYSTILTAVKYVVSVKETTCRKRTHHTYSSMVNTFEEWLINKHLDNIPVEDFNYYHAVEFMDYTMNKLKNGNRTYNNRASAMKSIFKVLVKREWILYNPFEKVEYLPEEQAEIRAFTTDELILMQETLPQYNYNLYVCACLIFYCFIRPQELVRLKVENINLRKRVIIIPGRASKNKKQEVVRIPDPLFPILIDFDMNFPGDYYLFGKNLQRGTVEYAPTRMAEAWRKYAEETGIGKNLYSLKHTGVGMAIENGINIRDLQLQLRHSNLEMTQVYLDKFNNRPSDRLSANFPDLARLAKNNKPFRSPPQVHTCSPALS